MVITSYGFLLVFLPLALLIYWRTRYKLAFLCLASYAFYALGDPIFVPLLLGLSLATYALARRKYIGLGIILNLAALALFKYWNFGVTTLSLPLLELALPLGISFYVFKHIGYLLDIRAGQFEPTSNVLLFITYSAFFPQISAGPMSLGDDTLKQLANLPARLSADVAYQGVVSISIGLVKKILIADSLFTALQAGFYPGQESGMIWAWSSVIVYALQLYFDFSSYTDMALGIGLLFGVTLPPNFNNPYLATNPADFWQRWHMSLSTWFRFYLFSPLSRALLRRWGLPRAELAQYSANLVTMGLIGLWHGTGWGFVLWGLYHGLLLNGFAWAKRRRIRVESHLLLIVSVLIGWALFASPTLDFAGHLFASLFGLRGVGSFQVLDAFATSGVLLALIAAVLMTLSGRVEAANFPPISRPIYAALLGTLVVLSIIHLHGAASFIYVQF